jgi:hypothetical protein
VINPEGWIVTAGHIMKALADLVSGEKAAADHDAKISAIRADASLSAKERSKRLVAVGRLHHNATYRAAAVWGHGQAQIVDSKIMNHIDLAIGRLEPFDPASVSQYPIFKDPTKDFETGTSLCKYGYPFNSVKPTWNDAEGKFEVPGNAMRMPLFPIEGIYTREVEVNVPGAAPLPAGAPPLKYVETSSPGLRGQSGGPTFDVQGAIWAIQSQTQHLPLGFTPSVTQNGIRQTEHQFLNVGWGVHAGTIIGLLTANGINHQVSAF